MKDIDTLEWLTYLCDADLRHTPAFTWAASKMSLETATELYVAYNTRKATRHGG